jgi:uncharacterized protein (DUF983 family)
VAPDARRVPSVRVGRIVSMGDRGRGVGSMVPLLRVLGRALQLRCPVCGEGRMFRGLLTMNRRCAHCGLWFERAPGYYLGSIYVNYAATGLIAGALYLLPMAWAGRPVTWMIGPVVAFCVVFPIVFFRYARSLWLAFDHYLSPLDVAERPITSAEAPGRPTCDRGASRRAGRRP